MINPPYITVTRTPPTLPRKVTREQDQWLRATSWMSMRILPSKHSANLHARRRRETSSWMECRRPMLNYPTNPSMIDIWDISSWDLGRERIWKRLGSSNPLMISHSYSSYKLCRMIMMIWLRRSRLGRRRIMIWPLLTSLMTPDQMNQNNLPSRKKKRDLILHKLELNQR